jgi:hypothetical protein
MVQIDDDENKASSDGVRRMKMVEKYYRMT